MTSKREVTVTDSVAADSTNLLPPDSESTPASTGTGIEYRTRSRLEKRIRRFSAEPVKNRPPMPARFMDSSSSESSAVTFRNLDFAKKRAVVKPFSKLPPVEEADSTQTVDTQNSESTESKSASSCESATANSASTSNPKDKTADAKRAASTGNISSFTSITGMLDHELEALVKDLESDDSSDSFDKIGPTPPKRIFSRIKPTKKYSEEDQDQDKQD